MLSWLRGLRRTPTVSVDPRPSCELDRPEWVLELLETIQKQSRASVKLGARLEAALAESDARIEALQAALEQRRAPERLADARAAAREHAPLFDALDALDEARRLIDEPHLAAGLSLVAERVVSFCEGAGFSRVRAVGVAVDPRLSRIVGAEVRGDVQPGHVSRVVRAAVLHGALLVREGEVIVSAALGREESPDDHVGN